MIVKNDLAQDSQEELVYNYLKKNPDFFVNHQDLLEVIQFTMPNRGIVSLVDLQLQRLRNKITELEDDIAKLMQYGQENVRLFNQLSQTEQKLFETKSVKEAFQVLQELAISLDLKVALKIFKDEKPPFVIDNKKFIELKQNKLVNNSFYLGRLRQNELDLFFNQATAMGSVAILELGKQFSIGALVFFSANGGHFQPNMDILFIQKIAALMTKLIDDWQL